MRPLAASIDLFSCAAPSLCGDRRVCTDNSGDGNHFGSLLASGCQNRKGEREEEKKKNAESPSIVAVDATRRQSCKALWVFLPQ